MLHLKQFFETFAIADAVNSPVLVSDIFENKFTVLLQIMHSLKQPSVRKCWKITVINGGNVGTSSITSRRK